MFYSHTFLARKGPLGTVWCAAHLQHKLKKSHYISVNVDDTVKRIMFPEVPIALRLSGHLLLGIVRIYSKQVDYLYDDCNNIRITINRVITTVSVNLPGDATHAPVHAITLPEKFDLDTMELDDYYKDWGADHHLKNQVDITLTEQIPTGKDPYIIISFDEHDLRASPFVEDDSGSGPTPMEEDAPPSGSETAAPDFGHPCASNQLGGNDRSVGNRSPWDLPSIEKMRDARHGFDFNNLPILPDRADPDTVLEEQINKDKEMGTPPTKEVVSPDRDHSLSHNLGEQHLFGHLDSPIPFAIQSPQMEIRSSPPVAHQSPEIDIRPSPPVAQPSVRRNRKRSSPPVARQSPEIDIRPSPPVAQPRVRKNRKRSSPPVAHQSPEIDIRPSPPVAKPRVGRNRKRIFDHSTVLSNEHMREALDDTSNIRRVKKNCPLSSLAIWKQNNRVPLRKEGLFVEPFITGCSADLQGIYKEDSAKRNWVSTEEMHQEENVAQIPDVEITKETLQETNAAQPPDTEIEILRNNEFASPDRFMLGPSTFAPSPSGRSCFTPDNSNLGLQSEPRDMTDGNEVSHTGDMGASGNLDLEVETPDTLYEKDMHGEGTALSDIPELVASPGELRFLEQDDNSPAGSQGTPASGMISKNQQTPGMSSRTRTVAQFLERQAVTPVSGNSDEPPEELSLDRILQGKPRKICARMFYETLVLKCLGLVETRQEIAYGDITLKLTPKLAKGKFST